MKKISLIIICLLVNLYHSQTVFLDDFGTSSPPTAANNYSRRTSPYVPTSNFTFGTSKANSANYTLTHIDNAHYAVIPPEFIYAGVSPGYYFWTLPTASSPNIDGANRYVEDHTPGDINGSVLVVNASPAMTSSTPIPNTPFYERNFSFEGGAYYEASFWMYVVNSTTQTRMTIKDPVSGNEIATGVSTAINGSPSTGWQEYRFTFRAPTGGCSNTVAKISLQNVFPGGGGNDYYIDDIKLTKLSTTPSNSSFTFTCPVNSVPVDTDNDGILNAADLDSDNDGILDCVENMLNLPVDTYFQLNGSSTKTSDNEIRLTANTNNQSGQAWSKGKVDFSKNFTLRFQANLGNNSGGADGIAAVFHNSLSGFTATGADGDGLGARGIQNGVVLELDTYANTSSPASDPAGSNGHGRIWRSSNQQNLTANINLGNLKNGVWRDVVVTWNAATQTLSYTVNGTNAGSYTFTNISTEIFAGSSKNYFGFTASTGGLNNNQSVRFLSPCTDLPIEIDTDGDGIPNHLDLDSDGDGCPDAVEGDENVTASMLYSDGSINISLTGGINGNGVPQVVNTGGSADIGSDVGQGLGVSQDISKIECLDTDSDGIPNYRDLDDDNDGILDTAENICETEGTPVYSNNFGSGNSITTDANVVGHGFSANNPSDGNYTVSRSLSQGLYYTQTNQNLHKDAGNPAITQGSNDGKFLIINVAANYVDKTLYRVRDITVTPGVRYRFRLDMAGLAENVAHIPNLRISIKNASGNVLASEDSNNIGMANDDIWRRLSMTFVATNPNITLEIINLQPLGSAGNDLGIDNIILAPINICDADGDGIENSLDLDSDNDGCFDAIEGDENVNTSHLNTDGSINYPANGGLGNVQTNNGVPNIVNSGAFDIGNDVGQGIGVSQDISKSDCLDSDVDGIANYLDLDDDNDGILDTEEGCSPTVTMGEVVTGGGPAALSNLQNNSTAVFPLAPPGATLPNGGVRVTRTSGGNGWGTYTPTGTPISLNVNGSQSATFPSTYIDIVGTIPRNVTIDFGVSANSLSTNNNDYQYIIGIAGLGGENQITSNVFSVPLTVIGNIDVFGGARYSLLDGVVSTTSGQTGTVVTTNSAAGQFGTQGYTFYFVPKSVASFVMSLGGGDDPHGFIFGVYNMNCNANTDGDSLPNSLDVDSDGDGCPDAIEGSELIKYEQVHALNLPSTDANYNYRGQIKVKADGVATGTPSEIISKMPNANGVPELVNPQAQNTSGQTGQADNTDVPASSDVGQGKGSSQDSTVNQCVCYNPANTVNTPRLETSHGITSLNRAGVNNGNWPMVRNGAWTALESKTKGFVPNRLTAGQISAIPAANLIEGMMVYNITLDCLQINTKGTSAGWKCFTEQTCTTIN